MPYNYKADRRKIVLLMLFIGVLIGAGVLIVDFAATTLGLNPPIPVLSAIRSNSFKKKIKMSEDPYLLEREELDKERTRLLLHEEQLINRENEIRQKDIETNKKMEALIAVEKDLEKKQELLDNIDSEIKDRKNNIREQAIKLYNMPPSVSVQLLEMQAESDIVDILRAIDSYSDELGRQSLSPYLISQMSDKTKAGNVIRKLKYNAGQSETGVESVDLEDLPPQP